MKNEIKQLKAKLRPEKVAASVDFKTGLSSSSALINLAITGRASVGLPKGFYYYLVGDSNSGKTYITVAFLAEASINKNFDNYRLIYLPVERGALMDIKKHFGAKLAQRIEYFYPETIEEFFFLMDDLLNDGRPFVTILDSLDGLTSEAEVEKFQEQKTAYRKGKEISGSYGDGKAKKNSSGIRQIIAKLEKTESILVIISQTRDNIGFGAQFQPKTRSGGNAPRFYAAVEIWTSIKKHLKKTAKGKQRDIGILCKVHVKRSRFTGRTPEVDVPIYWSSGIDDIGSMVDWLIEEKHWPENDGVVTASEFDFKGKKEALIQKVEEGNLEKALRLIVSETWGEIEEACEVKRKKRYV